MTWDQAAQTRGFQFKCGKCGGSDYYIAVQVMSQGKTNTFTKNVEVVTCKACDLPMMRRMGKGEKSFGADDQTKDVLRVFGFISAAVLVFLTAWIAFISLS
jgi:hypothetical protein